MTTATAERRATKKAKARGEAGPSKPKRDAGTVPAGPTAEQLRSDLAAAEKSLQKLDPFAYTDASRKKRADLEARIKDLCRGIETAEVREMPLPPAAGLKFREADVDVAAIISTGNHREVDDEAETLRLARTLATVGLQQRIAINDTADCRHELIFGSRRLAAAKSLGWEQIPAKVYERLTAAEVEILRTIENFGRRELSHVERAIAVARTIDAIEATTAPLSRRRGEIRVEGEPGPELRELGRQVDPAKLWPDQPEMIAAVQLARAIDDAGGLHAYVGQQLGFPPKWVRDNAYVSRIGGRARELLAAHRIDVAHARELAKLGDRDRADQIAEWCARKPDGTGGESLERCRNHVIDALRSLRGVPWRLDVAFGAGKAGCTGQACATCPFNSKADPELFGGVIADEPEAGTCTNEACFKAKQEITEKDLAKGAAAARKRAERSKDWQPTETEVTALVPIHVKPSSATRRAKREVEAVRPAKKDAAGDGGAEQEETKPWQRTAQDVAGEKLEEALSKWRDGVEPVMVAALKQEPRRLAALAMLVGFPGFGEYDLGDLHDDDLEKHAELLDLAGRCDVDALAAKAMPVILKRERWNRQIPILDGSPPDRMLERLAAGWGVELKPRPVLEDFLPKQAPIVPPRPEAYPLAELGLKAKDLEQACDPSGPQRQGRGKKQEPGRFHKIVTIRGRAYWCNGQGWDSDGGHDAYLRPLYTPEEWGDRPSDIDWTKLPGATSADGRYMTGVIGIDDSGQRWIVGPENESIVVQITAPKQKATPAETKPAPANGKLEAGDRVRLVGKKKTGRIAEIREDCLMVHWDGAKGPVRHPLEQHVARIDAADKPKPPFAVENFIESCNVRQRRYAWKAWNWLTTPGAPKPEIDKALGEQFCQSTVDQIVELAKAAGVPVSNAPAPVDNAGEDAADDKGDGEDIRVLMITRQEVEAAADIIQRVSSSNGRPNKKPITVKPFKFEGRLWVTHGIGSGGDAAWTAEVLPLYPAREFEEKFLRFPTRFNAEDVDGDIDEYYTGVVVKVGRLEYAIAPRAEGRRLVDRAGQPADPELAQRCRVCGCTEADCRNCIRKTGEPCHWVRPDLCSACTDPARKARYVMPAAALGYVGKDALEDEHYDALEAGARSPSGEIDLNTNIARIKRVLDELAERGLADKKTVDDGCVITDKGLFAIGHPDAEYATTAVAKGGG